jgi:hypothetical protein
MEPSARPGRRVGHGLLQRGIDQMPHRERTAEIASVLLIDHPVPAYRGTRRAKGPIGQMDAWSEPLAGLQRGSRHGRWSRELRATRLQPARPNRARVDQRRAPGRRPGRAFVRARRDAVDAIPIGQSRGTWAVACPFAEKTAARTRSRARRSLSSKTRRSRLVVPWDGHQAEPCPNDPPRHAAPRRSETQSTTRAWRELRTAAPATRTDRPAISHLTPRP